VWDGSKHQQAVKLFHIVHIDGVQNLCLLSKHGNEARQWLVIMVELDSIVVIKAVDQLGILGQEVNKTFFSSKKSGIGGGVILDCCI